MARATATTHGTADGAPAERSRTVPGRATSAQAPASGADTTGGPVLVAGAAPRRTVDPGARRQAGCAVSIGLVSQGDSLWSIARARLGADASDRRVARAVSMLWELNADRMPGGPDLLRTGQRLRLPSMTCT